MIIVECVVVKFIFGLNAKIAVLVETPANGALALITASLLNLQIASLEKAFVEEGGFTERLYRVRSAARKR